MSQDARAALKSSQGRMTVPRSRALVSDVLHFHQSIPTCAQDRLMPLRDLDEVRSGLPVRISWPVLLLKGFATVTARHPRLRQTWRTWPWPHIYQHRNSCGTIAVSRRFRDDDWLFWGRFRDPARTPLTDLQEQLSGYATRPVEQVFRRQLILSSFPSPLRRLTWWSLLNLSGEKRTMRTGAFSLSSVAGYGAEIQHPPGFVTSVLTIGPISSEGLSRVTIAYDHRIMDGGFVALRLEELEAELMGPLQAELLAIHDVQQRKAA